MGGRKRDKVNNLRERERKRKRDRIIDKEVITIMKETLERE